ncbi:MAG: hypothetical protein V1874_06560 [Spirochaetota bacterium]
MPVKKKAVAQKKSTPKKKTIAKKPKMVCGVCGMEVIVDKVCGCAISHPLICCDKPMQSK